MAPNVNSLMSDFAAAISNVDLNASFSNHDFEVIHNAVDAHGVAVFRDQFLEDDALVAFV